MGLILDYLANFRVDSLTLLGFVKCLELGVAKNLKLDEFSIRMVATENYGCLLP